MNNNEKFNKLLNDCSNPRLVMAALLALAKSGSLQQRRKDGAA